jgi:hypothetical protein
VSSAPAGWYRDPTGHSEHRYWDGTAWTAYVARGGEQSNDAITGDYAPPEVTNPWQLTAQRRRTARWPWVVGSVALACILFVGGCTTVLVLAVRDAVREQSAEQRKHAITRAQFDAVQLGQTKEAVIAALGKQPQNVQEFLRKAGVNADEIKSSCIYYNQVGAEFGARYQFCFEQGVLTSKGSFGS